MTEDIRDRGCVIGVEGGAFQVHEGEVGEGLSEEDNGGLRNDGGG